MRALSSPCSKQSQNSRTRRRKPYRMAKKKTDSLDEESAQGVESNGQIGEMLRAPAELLYAAELDAIMKADKHEKPPGWRMSARAVLTYICGGTVGGTTI